MNADAYAPTPVAMLLVGYPPGYSGAGAQAAQLAKALADQGVPVDVLCPMPAQGGAPARERDGNLRIFRFATPRADARFLWLGVRAAWWLLVDSQWRVLHLHGFNYWSLLPCLVAKLKRRPVLAKTTLLGQGADGALSGRLTLPQRAIAFGHRRVDAIVALSDALAQSFEEAKNYRAEIVRIPNGVDTDAFHPANAEQRLRARERFEIARDAAVIVTAGRLEARKNVVGLVRAAARLRARPVCLFLIGPPSPDPADRRELEAAIAALPNGIDVCLPGTLAPTELPEALRAADVLVLPSRAEGMPNSLLEGMASGLACLATDIPGSRDVLRHGGGHLVPLDDERAMAERLDAWLADPSERARVGREAREVVLAEYSLTSVASRYRTLHDRLAAGAR